LIVIYCQVSLFIYLKIISANKDHVTVTSASRYVQDRIEGSKLVVLAPSGHMSMLEQHQEFVEAVASFARKCSHSSSPANT